MKQKELEKVAKKEIKGLYEDSSLTVVTADMQDLSGVIWENDEESAATTKGYPIYRDGKHKKMAVTDGFCHASIISSTGKGKTQYIRSFIWYLLYTLKRLFCPNLIILDNKADIYPELLPIAKKKGFATFVLTTFDILLSTRFNPLSCVCDPYFQALDLEKQLLSIGPEGTCFEGVEYKTTQEATKAIKIKIRALKDRAIERLVHIANILVPIGSSKESCWSEGGQQLWLGPAIALLNDLRDDPKRREKYTLANVIKLAVHRANECEDLSEWLSAHTKDSHVEAAYNITSSHARQTRDSHFSILSSTVTKFASSMTQILTATSDFSIEEMFNNPDTSTVIFLCADSCNEATNAIVSMFVDQVMQLAIEAASQASTKKLPREWVAVLDELTNFPEINNLSKFYSKMRGLGFHFLMSIQNITQVYQVYGENDATTILDNSDLQFFMGSNHLPTKRMVAEGFGKHAVLDPITKTMIEVPLVHISDLEQLRLGEIYIKSGTSMNNIKTYMQPFFMRGDVNHDEKYALPPRPLPDLEEEDAILEVLQSRKKEEKHGFSLGSCFTTGEDSNKNFFDDILRQLEDENTDQEDTDQEESESEEYEKYQEALTSEMLRILWNEGFETDRVESIHDDWCIAFSGAVMEGVPTLFLRSEKIDLSYQELQAKLIGFEEMLVNMVIENPLVLDKDDAVSTLTHNQKYILKKYHMAKPFFESYAKAIVTVRTLSDEEFERRKKGVA